MNSFEEYLKELGLKPDTVYQHRKYVSCFLAWLAIENVSLVQVGYNDILDYADHRKKDDNSVNLVNRMLLAIRNYFTYLQKEDRLNHNPAAGISLKGSIRTVPGDLLEKAELEHLYESYAVKDERTHRNKVIVGLLVYQGLTREELETIRPKHLKLREGKIHIPATGKQNSRILPLAALSNLRPTGIYLTDTAKTAKQIRTFVYGQE